MAVKKATAKRTSKKTTKERDAVIVAAVRTAVGRARRGSLIHTRPEDMAAACLKELFNRAPQVKPEDVEDFICGCAMPEAEQGMNIARLIIFRAGLPISIPAVTVNRFCASGLEAIAIAAERIKLGAVDVAIAGGVESMTLIPMGGNKIVPHPELAFEYPAAFTPMGWTAEIVAKRYGITREMQDLMGVRSNELAVDAIKSGRFKEQIVPLKTFKYDGKGNKIEFVFDVDEGPREGTTMEVLSKLRPAFWKDGTVTAGNSSQMSDGASAVLLMSSEKAKEYGLKPLARFIGYVYVGVGPEEMGVGPAYAVPRLVEKYCKPLGIKFPDDIGALLINEAFAAQSVYCLEKLGLDWKNWKGGGKDKVNPNGGAIALGHPLGCTGNKLSVELVYHMRDQGLKYGIVTACVGGGQGVAGLFENLTL